MNGLQGFWLHCHDHCPALTQTYYFNAETSLMVELWVLLSFRWPPSLKHSLRLSFAAQFSGKVHEDSDYTAVNAVVYWHLDAETHPDGEVVSRIYLIPLCKRRESRITITLKQDIWRAISATWNSFHQTYYTMCTYGRALHSIIILSPIFRIIPSWFKVFPPCSERCPIINLCMHHTRSLSAFSSL